MQHLDRLSLPVDQHQGRAGKFLRKRHLLKEVAHPGKPPARDGLLRLSHIVEQQAARRVGQGEAAVDQRRGGAGERA